jgi:hypothetical protein
LTALRLIEAALSRSVVATTYYIVLAGQEQTVLAATTYLSDFFFKIFKSFYFGGQQKASLSVDLLTELAEFVATPAVYLIPL